MILETFLRQAKQKFSGVEKRDIELIFSEVLGLSSVDLITKNTQEISQSDEQKIQKFLQMRQDGHAFSEISGKKGFFNLEFLVTNDVLTPRPETEFLVEWALATLEKNPEISRVIDIGTGSGCIISSIAHNAPPEFSGKFLASDVSEKALDVAKKNAKNAEFSVDFRLSNLLENFSSSEIFGAILVTNLPYIPQKDAEWMDAEVIKGDPNLALFSGEKGLDLYIQFFNSLQKFPDFSAVCFEYDPPQTPFFQKFLTENFPKRKISFYEDLRGETRFGVVE